MIEPFCKDVHQWLTETGDGGMAVIHCKAGKGRTGFLISCYLVYSGMFEDATTALRFYAVKRTKNAKGVTIPSQIRYTHYFDRWLRIQRLGLTPLPQVNPVILTSVRIHGIPKVTIGKDIWFKIENNNAKFNSKGKVPAERRAAEDYILFTSSGRTGIFALDGDCQFQFFCGGLFESAKLFQFWFNTRFLVGEDEDRVLTQSRDNSMLQLVLPKSELDKACKDTKHKIFSDTFKIELIFHQV
jgi:phosphatidylinositol-3,4,5-trisphosphate 3-phosphatase/dual-specificity protein phosphatase PTEN